jgi:hypothetical protein
MMIEGGSRRLCLWTLMVPASTSVSACTICFQSSCFSQFYLVQFTCCTSILLSLALYFSTPSLLLSPQFVLSFYGKSVAPFAQTPFQTTIVRKVKFEFLTSGNRNTSVCGVTPCSLVTLPLSSGYRRWAAAEGFTSACQ